MAELVSNAAEAGGRRALKTTRSRRNVNVLKTDVAVRCSGIVQRKGAGYIGSHSYKKRFMELHRDYKGLGPALLVSKCYGGKVVAKTLLDGYDRFSVPSGKKSRHTYFEIGHRTRTDRRFRVEDEGQRNKWMDSIASTLKEHAAAMTPELRRRIDAYLKATPEDGAEVEEEDDEDVGDDGDVSGELAALDVAGACEAEEEAASPRQRAKTGEDFEAAHKEMLRARHASRKVRRSFRDRAAEAAAAAAEEPSSEEDDDDDEDDGDEEFDVGDDSAPLGGCALAALAAWAVAIRAVGERPPALFCVQCLLLSCHSVTLHSLGQAIRAPPLDGFWVP